MLKVENLCMEYEKFSLKNISFELTKGYILGFVGKNGAGKTTTLKSILNLAHKSSGKIEILGLDIDKNEIEIKERIGFALGEAQYYPRTKIKKIAKTFKSFFKNWNEEKYRELLERFKIDETKKIGELSSGMKSKLAIAFALSHDAELLILDEPTSGLDPIARAELLEIFQEIVTDGEKSIIFSTHITSDLDKCADYILLIQNGEIVAFDTKDNLIDNHRLVAGKKSELNSIRDRLIGFKPNAFGFTGLIATCDISKADNFNVGIPNIEDIMMYYDKEEIK